jgi:hypothetical protein
VLFPATPGASALLPAVWSAVAATGSFVTAILVWMVQRANLLESVRPELFLDDWSRSDAGAETDTVTFRSIQNVGRGAAFNVILTCLHPPDRPTAVMSSMAVSIVPLGTPKEVDCQVQLYWRWVKGVFGNYQHTDRNFLFRFARATIRDSTQISCITGHSDVWG